MPARAAENNQTGDGWAAGQSSSEEAEEDGCSYIRQKEHEKLEKCQPKGHMKFVGL